MRRCIAFLATPAIASGLVLFLSPLNAAEQLSELIVDPGATGSSYHTIQRAIDAAPAGAVIRIRPGVYTESLSITKPVHLRGESAKTVKLRGPAGTALDEGIPFTPLLDEKLGGDWRSKAGTPAYGEAMKALGLPMIAVTGASNVTISGLSITHRANGDRNSVFNGDLVTFIRSSAVLQDCEVVGGPANGIGIKTGATVTISNCLVAAHWGTGVAIGGRDARDAQATIIDSEIRNCYHRGITIASEQPVRVARSRIIGSSWHGIRYDDSSPTIEDCYIADSYRSGIYASGRTAARVRNNLFAHNAQSCWFFNTDEISRNTFFSPGRGGVNVIANSKPNVVANLFYANEVALSHSTTQGVTPEEMPRPEELTVRSNLFVKNKYVWRGLKDHKGIAELSQSPFANNDNDELDVESANEADLESLKVKYPERGSSLDIRSLRSWPITARETSILPLDGSRTSGRWRTIPDGAP